MPAKAKTKPTKKAAPKATKKSTKKPKWTVVSYKKIEARRIELGYSKSAMAVALGVTNSTYHNWRRGTTVPHPNQQEQIRDLMAALTVGAAPKKAAAPKTTKPTKPTKTTKASRASKRGRKSPGAVRKGRGDGSGGTHTMKQTQSDSHPLHPSVGGTAPGSPLAPGVIELTGAWINSQTKAPSAGSVYAFVRGLKGVLNEG
jgi:DNA-binding transcriptional regulator YiaG